jgi:hypothetical protein
MANKIKTLATSFQKEEENKMSNDVIDNIVNGEVDTPGTSTELTIGLTPEALQDFKNDVKQWIEQDTIIKRLQIAIKERKKLQTDLNLKILKFMIQYNIEDLNTKNGLIKCKTSQVKVPMGTKVVKEKLQKTFENNPKIISKINEIFDQRETKEKHSLKKIKF